MNIGIRIIGYNMKTNKTKSIALLAPSFIAEFNYPEIIIQLRKLGFDKVVELTFGAKMINRLYHKILEKNEKNKDKKLYISTVCPGIVSFVKQKYPQYKKNLIQIDSPMIATAKICKKYFPKHKTVFISPCNFKKQEAKESKYVDEVIDYQELRKMLNEVKLTKAELKTKQNFDKFYNDYTKVYPLSGGLSKTAHLIGVLKPGEEKIIDGISEVEKFLKSPDKNVRFLDVTFCIGGCIGGPCLSKETSLEKRREKLVHYLAQSKKQKMAKGVVGLIKEAKGIKFTKRY